jgi:hypothetical protein
MSADFGNYGFLRFEDDDDVRKGCREVNERRVINSREEGGRFET